ncbi:DUF5810 domain-containing protein [Halohasta salina]|uniref:DUF5810 domain-containing protein n=1 Tax=Halohasta salina TaxID=2961621 RepID=UPI0020A3EE97|nr:DUF5810 domain-containing protein [Halohasta salina]
MGYLCPVCAEPFGDAAACANHLAVTAILHGEDHDAWLADAVDEAVDGGVDTVDEGAGDWESIPRSELADLVADRAEETTDHDHPGEHSHTHPVDGSHEDTTQGRPAITESAAETAQLDADAEAILDEARELTERMQQRGPDDEGKES